jgi:hypothetical protein
MDYTDYKSLKEEELYAKIAELNKRIVFYSQMNNYNVVEQLRTYLSLIQQELSERLITPTENTVKPKRDFKRKLLSRRIIKND